MKRWILTIMLLLCSSLVFACPELDEEEEPKNPLRTLDDIRRLLKEKGDKLSEGERGHLLMLIDMYQTPLNFWAKVIDEDGKPLPGAKVSVKVSDDPSLDWEEDNSTVYELIADANARVSVLNKQGIGVDAHASAEGYATAYKNGRSASVVDFSIDLERENRTWNWPTERDPAVLVLRKKGPIPRIQYQPERRLKPPTDGSPLKVDVHDNQHFIEVRLWSSRPDDAVLGDRWDWRAEYRPVNGEMMIADEKHPIAAPEKGYGPTYEIAMKADQEDWRSFVPGKQRIFWVRWNDGAYAYVHMDVDIGREPTLTIKSWVNLDRNNSFEDYEAAESRYFDIPYSDRKRGEGR